MSSGSSARAGGLLPHNYGLATTALGLTKRYPDAYETFVGSIVTMVLRS
jgi:hypothetical protein